MSRVQDKLIGKSRMPVGDVISIREQVMEDMYIPKGIKREFVRSNVDCDWNHFSFPSFPFTLINQRLLIVKLL